MLVKCFACVSGVAQNALGGHPQHTKATHNASKKQLTKDVTPLFCFFFCFILQNQQRKKQKKNHPK